MMIDAMPHGAARMHIALCKVATARVCHDIVQRAVHLHDALRATHESPLASIPMLSIVLAANLPAFDHIGGPTANFV